MLRNFGNYWFLAESQQWLEDPTCWPQVAFKLTWRSLTSICRQVEMRPAVGGLVLALKGLLTQINYYYCVCVCVCVCVLAAVAQRQSLSRSQWSRVWSLTGFKLLRCCWTEAVLLPRTQLSRVQSSARWSGVTQHHERFGSYRFVAVILV